MNDNERYDLEIPEEGLDYDILDLAFNPTSETFVINAGIQPGMKVLDVGSGSGIMTHFLAQQVGRNGHVLSIDNSPKQLARAMRYCEQQRDSNITFKALSVYDLGTLGEQFDLIYCRFVLHHLHKPKHTIALFYQALNKGGIYIGEEGIISAAFSYPPSIAWQHQRETVKQAEEEKEGINRDGDFGMKLYFWMKKAGFMIKNANLVQPVLITYEQKKKLLDGHYAFKKTALLQGKQEEEWEMEKQELIRLAKDDNAIVGFYQSCQVCGVKS
jgi:ubiquinone/menaquinone biosynthesis C-methylase UbiE